MMSFSSGNFIVNKVNGKEVYFFDGQSTNIDTKTVESFGDEWETFDTFTDEEIDKAGGQYFDIVSDELLANKYVLDVGCGTGRWTKYVAKKRVLLMLLIRARPYLVPQNASEYPEHENFAGKRRQHSI